MRSIRLARLGLSASVLLLGLSVATPASAQSWLQSINRSDGSVSGVSGQTLVTSIPPGERGRCPNCRHISAYDNGFGNVTTFFGGTAWGLQEIRFAHDFVLDSLAIFRAPNASGGQVNRRVSEFGIRTVTTAEVAITVSATNPLTGEKKVQTDRFRVTQGQRTFTQIITVGGDDWLRLIGRWRNNNVPLSTQADSLKVRVEGIEWLGATTTNLQLLDVRVGEELRRIAQEAARQQAAQEQAAQEQAAKEQAAQAQAGSPASASGTTATQPTTGAGSATSTTAAGAAGSAGAARTPTRSTASTDSATRAREAEARRQSVDMIDGGRRQAEQDRARRQAQADELVATAAPAVVAVASMFGALVPKATFATYGLTAIGGGVGAGAFLEGGPGWKLTPRTAKRHVAISVPSLVLGFNRASPEDFTVLYRDIGEPSATEKPAVVSGGPSIGLGGNFYMDLPLNNTALNISAFKLWGGSSVEPNDDTNLVPGSVLIRAEAVRRIWTPRAYRRYGTIWALALGAGLHNQTLRYADENRERSKSVSGPVLSLRFVMIDP